MKKEWTINIELSKIGMLLVFLGIGICVFLLLHFNMKKEMERAYFEGQKAALSGDFRIIKEENGCYSWSKSPWNNGDLPVYNPSKNCN
jgi:hypothetical protein